MTIVIDASVIMKWIIPEDGEAEALALRTAALCAPAIWQTEVANGLRKYVNRKELSLRTAQLLLAEVQATSIDTKSSSEYLEAALGLAAELNHPIYDCIYLALAIRENTYVVTADKRFAALASKRADLSSHIRYLM